MMMIMVLMLMMVMVTMMLLMMMMMMMMMIDNWYLVMRMWLGLVTITLCSPSARESSSRERHCRA